MKSLKDFSKDLEKCSKCGLCQSVCPIFEITKNECCVSKGKFEMLLGVVKGDLNLSKNINKYIDLCLKCKKCNNFCPSSIDVCSILSVAKYKYAKKTKLFKLLKLFESQFIFSNFLKIVHFFTKPFRPKKLSNDAPTKVLYFKGCINNIFPHTDIYLDKILKNTDIQILTQDFECCGIPFLTEGNLERFIEVAQINSEKIIKSNSAYLVTDCATCQDTILNYHKYLDNYDFSSIEAMNWGDIIARKNLKFHFKNKIKVTFHKPCHLDNDDFFENIIKNSTNVEYIKMKDYDSCCGFAGSFFIKNPKLHKKLLDQKIQNIKSTNTDYVITTCPECLIGLKKGLMFSKTKALSLLEFLAKASSIS